MKTKLLLAVMLLLGMSSVAIADEPAKPADAQAKPAAKPIQVVSADIGVGSDIRILPKDYPNGVFVIARRFSTHFTHVEAIITERFRARGFKIADSAETADRTLTMVAQGELSLADADQELEGSTNWIGGEKVVATIGDVVLTHGVTLVTDLLSLRKPMKAGNVLSIDITDPKGVGQDITQWSRCTT